MAVTESKAQKVKIIGFFHDEDELLLEFCELVYPKNSKWYLYVVFLLAIFIFHIFLNICLLPLYQT